MMADALHSGESRDYWTEVQRMQRKYKPPATEIDGEAGEEAICNMFAGKYEDLYNSVPFEQDQMEEVLQELNAQVRTCCMQGECYSDHNVSVMEVHKAIRSLKRGKSDTHELLSSDHFKNACNELHVHISLLLQMLLANSIAPMTMLESILVPIPKNRKKPMCESSNYRSIALSSIIGKIWDKIILSKHAAILSMTDLQFCFRPGHSTTQCTFALQEIADHYVRGGSSTLITLLDASKAFDCINYAKLFRLLLKRKLCPLTAKLLLVMYTTQTMAVRWGGTKSDSFSCSNGVKQGAVLSPVLFCVYMEELLKKLEASGIGCYIGHRYAGALCYADDVALIAPSLHAMKCMLRTCEEFATSYQVRFNSSKSVSMVLGHVLCAPVTLHGDVIPRASQAIHLGHYIGKNAHQANTNKAKSELCSRINALVFRFKHCSLNVIRHLFCTYCTSYYGCPLWDHSALDSYSTFWRKCIRRILGLPPRTHSRFIAPLLNKPDLKTQFHLRFANFISSCFNSSNELLKACALSSLNSHSTVANNLRIVLSILRMDYDGLTLLLPDNSLKDALRIKCQQNELQNPEDDIVIAVIEELIDIKNGHLHLAPLLKRGITELLHALCTD